MFNLQMSAAAKSILYRSSGNMMPAVSSANKVTCMDVFHTGYRILQIYAVLKIIADLTGPFVYYKSELLVGKYQAVVYLPGICHAQQEKTCYRQDPFFIHSIHQ